MPAGCGCGGVIGHVLPFTPTQGDPPSNLKKLQERYGRFHARFPLDDVYLALPRAIRNDAYLYLLALSGNQRAEEADRNVPLAVASSIATMMGLKATRMLEALAAIKREDKSRIVEITSTHAVLLKHGKWQDTPEEIAELKAKRSRAGSEGAAVRWGQPAHIKDARESVANAIAPATAPRKASAIARANSKNGKPITETEKEIETESLSPPSPPLPQALELLTELSRVLGIIQPKGTDYLTAERMWLDFHRRYEGVADMVATVEADMERRQREGREPIHSLEGCRIPLRWTHDLRADEKPPQRSGGRVESLDMDRLGDVISFPLEHTQEAP